MDREELRQIVADQVRRALSADAAPVVAPAPAPDGPTVVAAFCGGRGGLTTALEQVREVAEKARVVGVLSPAAKEIVGADRLNSEAGAHEIVLPDSGAHPWDLAHRADAVAVAQLTRTTLARLALGLGESLISSMALHALWDGKPVIVARDGVDPDLAACEESEGAVDVARELVRLYDDYLERLVAFGCQVVPAAGLAETVRAALAGETPGLHRPLRTRRVITEQDVIRASRRGESINITGAVVTPLARDTARDLGVSLVEE
jgi:hypothetical protein